MSIEQKLDRSLEASKERFASKFPNLTESAGDNFDIIAEYFHHNGEVLGFDRGVALAMESLSCTSTST